MGIICQSIHPEKPVLKVWISVGGRRSSDEIQDLDCVRLGHRLHNIVKLGLDAGKSFKAELRFGLSQPCLNVIRPEGRKLDRNNSEQVCGRRNILVFLNDSRISRHGLNLCKLCNQNPVEDSIEYERYECNNTQDQVHSERETLSSNKSPCTYVSL